MSTRTATARQTHLEAGYDPFTQFQDRLDILRSGEDAPSGPPEGRNAANTSAAFGGDDVTATVTNRRKGRPPMSSLAAVQSPPTAPDATPGIGSNSSPFSFENVLAKAQELGGTYGKAKDSQVKFGMITVQSAYHGQLNLDPHRHGKDKADAVVLAEAYVKAQNSSAIFDAKAPNQRKLASTLRTLVKLGGTPKWGSNEPLQTMNKLMTMRQTIRAKGGTGKIDDAFNTLMRWARAQLKEDQIISGPLLEQFIYKREGEPRTAEEVIRAIQKMASNLKVGKVAGCPEVDNSKEVGDIVNLCNKRLTALAKAKSGQA